jgi:hypothetical protein
VPTCGGRDRRTGSRACRTPRSSVVSDVVREGGRVIHGRESSAARESSVPARARSHERRCDRPTGTESRPAIASGTRLHQDRPHTRVSARAMLPSDRCWRQSSVLPAGTTLRRRKIARFTSSVPTSDAVADERELDGRSCAARRSGPARSASLRHSKRQRPQSRRPTLVYSGRARCLSSESPAESERTSTATLAKRGRNPRGPTDSRRRRRTPRPRPRRSLSAHAGARAVIRETSSPSRSASDPRRLRQSRHLIEREVRVVAMPTSQTSLAAEWTA